MWAIREVLIFWKCCYIGLGFEESKLMGYKSYEEYDNLYSRGSGNGGIAAAFGELRYAKCFCQSIALNTPQLLLYFKQAVLAL